MFDGFKFISEIKIPDSVTNLGIGSFGACVNLETVEIGKGMNTFDNTSFGDCLKLEKIIVSPENEKFADVDGVLFNKEKTELICFPAYWINSCLLYTSLSLAYGCRCTQMRCTPRAEIYAVRRLPPRRNFPVRI